jgi:Tfp pilus assembly protein PilO
VSQEKIMARNRRRQSAELRFGPALKALLICVFIGGAGVGYVYQMNLLNQLGEEKKAREEELYRLWLDNSQKERQVSQLNSQRQLERRVRQMHPDLGLPSPSQIVVLTEESADAEEGLDSRYASGGAGREYRR